MLSDKGSLEILHQYKVRSNPLRIQYNHMEKGSRENVTTGQFIDPLLQIILKYILIVITRMPQTEHSHIKP